MPRDGDGPRGRPHVLLFGSKPSEKICKRTVVGRTVLFAPDWRRALLANVGGQRHELVAFGERGAVARLKEKGSKRRGVADDGFGSERLCPVTVIVYRLIATSCGREAGPLRAGFRWLTAGCSRG